MILRHAIAALLIATACLSTPANAQHQQETDPPKRLLMHVMPWYETPEVRGFWGGHWTGWGKHDPEQIEDNGLPDIYSHYHPLIGLYDSADPHVIECQLLQMKLAGVDGIIVDWYGISDAVDYPIIHTATLAIFEQTRRLGMEFAVCYEDRTIQLLVEREHITPDQITEHLTQTMQWLQDNWFQQPNYTRINGHPLLLNFGPIYVSDPKPWQTALNSINPRPRFFALHHLWKNTRADGGFTWVHDYVWDNNPTPAEIRERLQRVHQHPNTPPHQMIPSAVAGYHDIYENSLAAKSHRDGDTLREMLDVAMQGDWPIVQLVTWNDYGEGTMIEPTHEFGYLFLEIIQQARRQEQPQTFTHTPEDLRLPAQLLKLRQQAKHAEQGGQRHGDAKLIDEVRLNAIALNLAAGKTEAAREQLNRLIQPTP
ncbi:glycoside hydrolase family 71/99-like protein [Mucisphaera sp.]|uniref:glycoside hydrolase family 71/99-like protein n=1 Tax=Mucisphaera sp. TaxID=2913024 RepID=UPI003D0AF9E3